MDAKALKIAKGFSTFLTIGPRLLNPAFNPATPALCVLAKEPDVATAAALLNTVSLDALAASSKGPDSFLRPGMSFTNSESEEKKTVLLSTSAEDSAKSPKESAKL